MLAFCKYCSADYHAKLLESLYDHYLYKHWHCERKIVIISKKVCKYAEEFIRNHADVVCR